MYSIIGKVVVAGASAFCTYKLGQYVEIAGNKVAQSALNCAVKAKKSYDKRKENKAVLAELIKKAREEGRLK